MAVSSWWEPPAEVVRLAPRQRVAFGLVCAEHVRPSFESQVHAHPASLPAGGPSITEYQRYLELLWAWVPNPEEGIPECLTEEEALEAEAGTLEGLVFLVAEAISILCYARSSYAVPEHAVSAGRCAFGIVDELVQALMGPRPIPSYPLSIEEDARIWGEREDAVAGHELVRIEKEAQADAVEALAAGGSMAELRDRAQAVGRQIAEWTARLL